MIRARNNAVTDESRKTTIMIWTQVKDRPGKDAMHGYPPQSARNQEGAG